MNEVQTLKLAAAVVAGGNVEEAAAGGWMRLMRARAGPRLSDLPCRSVDPEMFFAESAAQVERAKAVCQACPVRQDCLLGALERREPWGVWGGEVLANGKVIPIKRGRGRPRKNQPAPAAPRRAA